MAPKPKSSPVAKKATAHKAKPKGLQLSAAQWKAYTSAYNSVANAGFTKLAIQSSAAGLRKYRLGAAHGLQKKVAATHAAARTAAIAKFAAAQTLRQSRLGHQNAALRNRVYANYARHVQVASRLQFSYRGEKVYLHTAVMNTLTTSQAVAIETAAYAKAAKAAKAAVSSTAKPAASTAKSSPAVARITAAAKAAGLAAAKATPAGRTAPKPPELAAGGSFGFGSPDGYDCVAAAIASHMQMETGYRLSRRQFGKLAMALGEAPEIEEALNVVMRTPPWRHFVPQLTGYARVPPVLRRGVIAGFATAAGPHAALLTGSRGYLVSWSEVLRLEEVLLPGTEIEEAWALTWVR
jgi:hypothetical protein